MMSYSKNSIRKSKGKKTGCCVILTGFRATGKSVVGRHLAEMLGYGFLDTDTRLSQQFGTGIAEFVAHHGWQRFRRAEEDLLRELAGKKRLVVATGGGSILHTEAWQRLRRHGTVVWLQASRETILARLEKDRKTARQRPPLTGMERAAEVDALLAERIPLYRAGSDLRVQVEGRDPRALAEHILHLLGQKGLAGRSRQAEDWVEQGVGGQRGDSDPLPVR